VAVTLDLSFLSVPLRLTAASASPPQPVNVYDILSDGWRELRVDMTLQFFLDPNERHGLGPLVIDALLTLLDGVPTIGPAGKTDKLFVAEDCLGSDAWEISQQVAFIDILATNTELGTAVVLENKIGHELNNPLDRYAAHALGEQEIATVLVAVLGPEHRKASDEQENWLSRSLTYSELIEQIKASPELIDHLLSPTDRDQRRSLDLLQQFIEARNGGADVTDLAGEAARLDEWRNLLSEHGEAIGQFLEARRRAGSLLRDRNKRLAPLIAAGFEDAELKVGWEAHGGYDAQVWNAYHFPAADWSVELILPNDPARPSIYVDDYLGRTYKNRIDEPLGLGWTTSDQEVSDAFVERVKQILEQVRSGTRGG
jgi:hypothetical protein